MSLEGGCDCGCGCACCCNGCDGNNDCDGGALGMAVAKLPRLRLPLVSDDSRANKDSASAAGVGVDAIINKIKNNDFV